MRRRTFTGPKEYAKLAHDPKAILVLLIWACNSPLKERVKIAWSILRRKWRGRGENAH